jgi:membrane-associated protease RseP (regulator of RpoE activity)
VEDEHSGDWLLDIGAGGGGLFYPFAKQHGLTDRKGVEGLAGGAGGYFKVKVSEFRSIELGGFRLPNQLLSMPLEEGGVLGRREGVGIIGNNILRHFVLYLDYERQQVVLEKGDEFDREFPRGKSGLGPVVTDDEKIEVLFISPGSPAEKAGFQPGDIVTEINRIAVEHLAGLLAIKELFEADAGTEYMIEILRDGSPMTLKLTLEDLY